ncbi:hypothetical protein [Chryseobacterium sp. POE27]|uniref:hypothetical protein n=1 Tax=Chryseobacterium sp. POE27 TaxID=3138177 RepID=UPI00321B9F00
MYTRFYIYPTDTILPYSIYKHAEKDYHGRLERIDSYNKKDGHIRDASINIKKKLGQ